MRRLSEDMNPNLMRLHQVCETDNSIYLVLDLLKGGTLYDFIKKNKVIMIVFRTHQKTRTGKTMFEGLLEGCWWV